MISKIPQVCRAINTMSIPRTMYHHEADVPISFPASDAITPNALKVTADPAAKVMDKRKAVFVSLRPVPPTYPMTSGILESEHGVNDVRTPAQKASIGASQPLSFMICARFSSKVVPRPPPYQQV